jgi:hypothetical protein
MRWRALVLGYFMIPAIVAVGDALTRLVYARLGIFSLPLECGLILVATLAFGLLFVRSAAVRVCPNAALAGIVIGFVLWFGMHAALGRFAVWTPESGQIAF